MAAKQEFQLTSFNFKRKPTSFIKTIHASLKSPLASKLDENPAPNAIKVIKTKAFLTRTADTSSLYHTFCSKYKRRAINKDVYQIRSQEYR